MPLGIDPTVDYAFKKLFGDPANSDLLIHLLNAVLQPTSPVVQVQILNPFNEKEFAEDKLSVLDIKAATENRAWFNVEMQSHTVGWLRQRIVYYNACLFVEQLREGEHYHGLLPAISICFLKEPLFPGVATPHLRFMLTDDNQHVRLCESLEIHTIELPKYNYVGVALPAAEALTQWAFFLDRAAELDAAELKRLLPGREYAKATDVMENIARTPQERERYESRRKAEMDFRAGLDEAREEGERLGLEKGERLGLEKGERLGLEKGQQLGLEKGEQLGLERGQQLGLEKGKQLGLEKGEQLGLERGERLSLLDQIRFLQGLLQVLHPAASELERLELAELRQLCSDLRSRLQLGR